MRYLVELYYTHIKKDGLHTQQVKKFGAAYDTLEAALKRARQTAKGDKGIYMTTLIDTNTGEIVYQKIEVNNMGMGIWMYD